MSIQMPHIVAGRNEIIVFARQKYLFLFHFFSDRKGYFMPFRRDQNYLVLVEWNKKDMHEKVLSENMSYIHVSVTSQ